MKHFFITSVLIFINLSVCNSQEYIRCGQNTQSLTEADLKLAKEFRSNLRIGVTNRRIEASEIVIPVVVHVVYNKSEQKISYEQVLSQIEVLNKDYNHRNTDTAKTPAVFKAVAAGANVKFSLAIRDPEGNPTNGVTYTATNVASFTDNDDVKKSSSGGKDAWDTRYYLNVWVSNLQGGLLGYYPPDISKAINTPFDGVVVAYRAFGTLSTNLTSSYNLGRTTTHEIGHWFGLFHPWGPPGTSSCSDDHVNDTPPQSGASTGCPKFPYIAPDCNNGPYGRNFADFMDYTADACMNMFTAGQVELMRSSFQTYRSSIYNSNGLKPLLNRDLSVIILADSAEFCSRRQNYPSILIRNVGKDTIKSFSVSITANSTRSSVSYNGFLSSGQDTVLELDQIDVQENPIELSAEVLLDDPSGDEYITNNINTKTLKCPRPSGIYPNPVNNSLYVSSDDDKIIRAKVYSLTGEKILEAASPVKINMAGLNEGFYLIILETSEKATRHQFVVIHD